MSEKISQETNKPTFGRKKSGQELLLQASESYWSGSFDADERQKRADLKQRLEELWGTDEETLTKELLKFEQEARESGLFSQDHLLDQESEESKQLL